MKHKIPVTVITGFLGAGKTTLINQLLSQPTDEKMVVIVNEYGDVGVDHQLVLNVEEEIFQMNNGCICCTLRTDLTQTLDSILAFKEEGRLQADRIVIETTGLAEPGPIAQTFLRTPFLQESFEIDSVVTVVDATNVLYQLSHYEESVEQIAFADQLALTKTDQVEDSILKAVKNRVREINPFAYMQVVDLENFKASEYVGRELFSSSKIEEFEVGEDHTHDDHDHHHHEHDHHHDHDEHDHHHHHHDHTAAYDTLSLKAKEPLHPALIDMWMNELIMTFGMDLLRYKGVLHLYGDPNEIVCQGVNMAFTAERGKPWEDRERESVLVFIGKNLPVEEMRESFRKCVMSREVMEELNFNEEMINEIVG